MKRDGFHSNANKKRIRKLNKFAFGFLEGKMDFHPSWNSIYFFTQMLKAILFCSIKGRYLENGLDRLEEIAKYKVPDADTVYRRIKKKKLQEILDEFLDIMDGMVLWLRKARKVPEKITVLIDEHDIPWFGKDKPYLMRSSELDGTTYCFRYITINAVISGYRICLYALPVTPFSRRDELVDKLLESVEKRFRIRLILFDRGFSQDSKVLKVVENHELKYLAPIAKNSKIKKLIEGADWVRIFRHLKYEHGSKKVQTNLFFVPNGEKKEKVWKNYHAFCTNLDTDGSNIYSLAKNYKERWNIENFYRDAQENFMIKTKTREFRIRLFFFLFSAILYNRPLA